MSMRWAGWVSVLAVVLVGLIAGLLVGTAIEQKTLLVLNPAAWTIARHSTDAVFSRLLPWWWNSTLILLFVAAYLNRGAARWMFLASGLLLLAGIVVTVAIEVPINKQVVTWDPQALPENFVAIHERWLQFHVVRTVMGAVGFVCAAVGLALGGGSAFAGGDGVAES